mmetsp:Transcript_21644/g.30330  ORF Transcript_21644/g.30330 Transcript_21644/m.30330 type:complete len:242 (+) Transcript_21644:63-788(+)|eukprot:CAMPEP_0184865972 /NCGR_PEP_ID=MMETSP0580-20130426/20067_1 /TAXON_ID=1118495 /ORGANISM="Dactyliosolen fragilissimus" /LENGTH=241 /DNA_ID=CAMNT_0027365391 /DNA_START=54 /DNA_END=779 /DNA_ORIENTATION=+
MMIIARSFLSALLVIIYLSSVECWSMPSCHQKSGDYRSDASSSSRRKIIQQTSATIVGSIFVGSVANPSSSFAASTPSDVELRRLQEGYSRVIYLLNNWESLTQKCGKVIMSDNERRQIVRTEGGGGGSGCEKTPLIVQDFLGYKSTNDPLFKADKLMLRAAPLVDPDDFEAYLDTVEKYREKADQGAMMAYTSSWGEANPNGGKEVIDDYLERTKLEVIQTEGYLRTILGYLQLPIPSTL